MQTNKSNYRVLNIFLLHLNLLIPTQSLPRLWIHLSITQEPLKYGTYLKNYTFLVISYMNIMYLVHIHLLFSLSLTLPNPFPSYIQFPCFLFCLVLSPLLFSSFLLLLIFFLCNPWSSFNAVYIYMDVELSTGARRLPWTKPLERTDFLP